MYVPVLPYYWLGIHPNMPVRKNGFIDRFFLENQQPEEEKYWNSFFNNSKGTHTG